MSLQPYKLEQPARKALNRSRKLLGPPGFYPTAVGQREDVMDFAFMKSGYSAPKFVTNENGSLKASFSLSSFPEKSHAFSVNAEQVRLAQELLCTLTDIPGSGISNLRKHFAVQKLKEWMGDLSSGQRSLGDLIASYGKIPMLKWSELLSQLVTFETPLLHASWFLKLTLLSEIELSKKRSPMMVMDMLKHWTAVLIAQISKLFQSIFSVSTTADSEMDVNKALRKWHYSVGLLFWLLNDGLLDRQRCLSWVVGQIIGCAKAIEKSGNNHALPLEKAEAMLGLAVELDELISQSHSLVKSLVIACSRVVAALDIHLSSTSSFPSTPSLIHRVRDIALTLVRASLLLRPDALVGVQISFLYRACKDRPTCNESADVTDVIERNSRVVAARTWQWNILAGETILSFGLEDVLARRKCLSAALDSLRPLSVSTIRELRSRIFDFDDSNLMGENNSFCKNGVIDIAQRIAFSIAIIVDWVVLSDRSDEDSDLANLRCRCHHRGSFVAAALICSQIEHMVEQTRSPSSAVPYQRSEFDSNNATRTIRDSLVYAIDNLDGVIDTPLNNTTTLPPPRGSLGRLVTLVMELCRYRVISHEYLVHRLVRLGCLLPHSEHATLRALVIHLPLVNGTPQEVNQRRVVLLRLLGDDAVSRFDEYAYSDVSRQLAMILKRKLNAVLATGSPLIATSFQINNNVSRIDDHDDDVDIVVLIAKLSLHELAGVANWLNTEVRAFARPPYMTDTSTSCLAPVQFAAIIDVLELLRADAIIMDLVKWLLSWPLPPGVENIMLAVARSYAHVGYGQLYLSHHVAGADEIAMKISFVASARLSRVSAQFVADTGGGIIGLGWRADERAAAMLLADAAVLCDRDDALSRRCITAVTGARLMTSISELSFILSEKVDSSVRLWWNQLASPKPDTVASIPAVVISDAHTNEGACTHIVQLVRVACVSGVTSRESAIAFADAISSVYDIGLHSSTLNVALATAMSPSVASAVVARDGGVKWVSLLMAKLLALPGASWSGIISVFCDGFSNFESSVLAITFSMVRRVFGALKCCGREGLQPNSSLTSAEVLSLSGLIHTLSPNMVLRLAWSAFEISRKNTSLIEAGTALTAILESCCMNAGHGWTADGLLFSAVKASNFKISNVADSERKCSLEHLEEFFYAVRSAAGFRRPSFASGGNVSESVELVRTLNMSSYASAVVVLQFDSWRRHGHTDAARIVTEIANAVLSVITAHENNHTRDTDMENTDREGSPELCVSLLACAPTDLRLSVWERGLRCLSAENWFHRGVSSCIRSKDDEKIENGGITTGSATSLQLVTEIFAQGLESASAMQIEALTLGLLHQFESFVAWAAPANVSPGSDRNPLDVNDNMQAWAWTAVTARIRLVVPLMGRVVANPAGLLWQRWVAVMAALLRVCAAFAPLGSIGLTTSNANGKGGHFGCGTGQLLLPLVLDIFSFLLAPIDLAAINVPSSVSSPTSTSGDTLQQLGTPKFFSLLAKTFQMLPKNLARRCNRALPLAPFLLEVMVLARRAAVAAGSTDVAESSKTASTLLENGLCLESKLFRPWDVLEDDRKDIAARPWTKFRAVRLDRPCSAAHAAIPTASISSTPLFWFGLPGLTSGMPCPDDCHILGVDPSTTQPSSRSAILLNNDSYSPIYKSLSPPSQEIYNDSVSPIMFQSCEFFSIDMETGLPSPDNRPSKIQRTNI